MSSNTVPKSESHTCYKVRTIRLYIETWASMYNICGHCFISRVIRCQLRDVFITEGLANTHPRTHESGTDSQTFSLTINTYKHSNYIFTINTKFPHKQITPHINNSHATWQRAEFNIHLASFINFRFLHCPTGYPSSSDGVFCGKSWPCTPSRTMCQCNNNERVRSFWCRAMSSHNIQYNFCSSILFVYRVLISFLRITPNGLFESNHQSMSVDLFVIWLIDFVLLTFRMP